MSPSGRSSSKGSSRSTEKSTRTTLSTSKKASSTASGKLASDPTTIAPKVVNNSSYSLVPVSKGLSQLASSLYSSVPITVTTHTQQYTSTTISGNLIRFSKEAWGTPVSLLPNAPPTLAPTATVVRGYGEASTTGILVPLTTAQKFNPKSNVPLKNPHTIMKGGKPTPAITLHSDIRKSAIIPTSTYSNLPKPPMIWNVSAPPSVPSSNTEKSLTPKILKNKKPPVICITTSKEPNNRNITQLVRSAEPPPFYSSSEIVHLTAKTTANPNTKQITNGDTSEPTSQKDETNQRAKVTKEVNSKNIQSSVESTVTPRKRSKKPVDRYIPTSTKKFFEAVYSKSRHSSKKTTSKSRKNGKKSKIKKKKAKTATKPTVLKYTPIPTYRLTGKEPLFVQKGNETVFNENLRVHKPVNPNSITKPVKNKICSRALKCYPVTSESEEETSYVLPKLKRPLPRYDFKNNIVKRRKICKPQQSKEESDDCETQMYQNPIPFVPLPFVSALAREEERALKRQKLNPNIGSEPTGWKNLITPKPGSSPGFQIINNAVPKIVRKNPVVVTTSSSVTSTPLTSTTNSTTNSPPAFPSTSTATTSSTATTNVTQVTNTPIVSSFVKEPIASTSKAIPSNTNTTIPASVEKSIDTESPTQRTKTKEGPPPPTLPSPAKSKDVQSSPKGKSKDAQNSSKSKAKELTPKAKSKEASSRKNKGKDGSPVKGKSDATAVATSKNNLDEATSESVPTEKAKSVKAKNAESKNAKVNNPVAAPASAKDPSVKEASPRLPSTSNNAEKLVHKPPSHVRIPHHNNEPYDFGADIKIIMQAFGDCEDQNLESVKMMEIIVREELNGFIYICETASFATGVKVLHIREAVFALRREKHRLGRLFRYFKTRENRKASRQLPHQVNKEAIVTYEAELREIIDEIDETGEYARLFENGPETALKDCELRADRVVQRLTMPKFLMFSKARSISYARKMPRLSEWVSQNLRSRRLLSLAFIEILGFLTYEIVSEVMNMAIAIRSERLATNVFERVMDNRGLNPDTCMSDPAFLKKRCFGLQNVSETLVQAGELQAMRFKKSETRTLNFNSEYCKQILPLDIRDGYLRLANEHLLEPSSSYKCEARRVAHKIKLRRRLRSKKCDKTSKKTGDKTGEKNADETSEIQIIGEKTGDKTNERTTSKPSEKPIDKTSEKTPNKPSEKPIDRTTNKTNDKTINKINEKTINKPSERPIDKTSNKTNEKTTNKPSERPIDKTSNRTSEKINNKHSERINNKPSEKINNKPSEKINNKPTEKINNKPTEKINNKPTEKISNKPNEKMNKPSDKTSNKMSVKT